MQIKNDIVLRLLTVFRDSIDINLKLNAFIHRKMFWLRYLVSQNVARIRSGINKNKLDNKIRIR